MTTISDEASFLEADSVPLHGLLTALESWEEPKVPVATIALHLHEEGMLFWMLLFTALPALPLPVPPGVNLLVAAPVLWVALQVMIGRQHLWVPGWFGRYRMKTAHVIAGVRYIQKLLKKLQKLSRLRLRFLLHRQAQKLQGILWFACGLSIAIPLPFTNTTPSLGILVSACGLLLRDGLIVLGGIGICGAGLVLTSGILLSGQYLLHQLQWW